MTYDSTTDLFPSWIELFLRSLKTRVNMTNKFQAGFGNIYKVVLLRKDLNNWSNVYGEKIISCYVGYLD